MNKIILTFLISLIPIISIPSQTKKEINLTQYVNPFIGTGGHGHTYPGASVPFGMVQLSPDTRLTGWDGCSGYHYSDSVIYGFSHIHLSGTGASDYCDILLMPTTGEIKFNNKEYSSGFSHANEKATTGYYSVLLDKYGTKVELTATKRAGFHKYIFTGDKSNFIIDLKHRSQVLESNIKFVNNNEICGFRRSKKWAKNKYIYFVMKFSESFIDNGIAINDTLSNEKEYAEGKNIKAFVTFNTNDKKEIYVKVGISGVSIEGAYKNLESEIPDWDFDKVANDAKEDWNKELNKIVVEGGSDDRKTIFYTALYHSFLTPNLFMDVDGQFRGTDKNIHKANGFENHTVFSLWDTYRAEHPLFTIVQQKRTNDFINTFLAEYEYGGMLPVWELFANETFCMIGYHSVPVIVDAFVKGIRGYDYAKAFDAMRHSADTNLFGLEFYRKYGHVPQDYEDESVSKTLEYAYDDWCIAQYAKLIGNESEYIRFIQRGQYYKNVLDPSTGFMRAKVNGGWYKPFEPAEVNYNYTEANCWQYNFYVPQDLKGFAKMMGGKNKLSKKLDELFITESKLTGNQLQDISGMIGQYAHGNEPSHHIAYLYNYVNEPYKTQKIVHKIMTEFYKNDPDGLIGNEDCGQMSAWYVMSALGFYSVCPGQKQYAIGTPMFDKATINLENGKQFVIKAKNISPNNYYIRSAVLNGKKYGACYLNHDDILNGGEIIFQMSNSENKQWGSKDSNIPTTEIKDYLINPVPIIEAEKNIFKDNLKIEIKNILPGKSKTKIYFTVDGSEPDTNSFDYKGPIIIDKTTRIKAFSYNEQFGKSFAVTGDFVKIPSGRSITLYSQYDSKYNAGGPDGLIDLIRGEKSWKLGGWQGYLGTDFEAVVDLGEIQSVKKLGAGFLQNVMPCIFMPSEIEISVSDDNKNYKIISTIKNDIPDTDLSVIIKDFTIDVKISTRYVKVKAKNYGKIPIWHPEAGDDSYIFVDEVIIE
jgi:predicted alpha-1,2-mannosidase